MHRQEFTQLLQRYLNNQCTEPEKELVEYWYALLEANPYESGEVDFEAMEARLWQKIKPVGTQEATEPPPAGAGRFHRLPRRLFYRAGIAATVLLVSLAGWLAYSVYDKAASTGYPVVQTEVEWVEKENRTRLPDRITLADGSTVTLGPGSRLRHPVNFSAASREVQLSGEAFFEVEKNPSRPFLVYAGPVVTKVLGTSFRVSAVAGQPEVQVEVVTGRVSVYEQATDQAGAESNGVVLPPNHRATYFTSNKLFTTGLVSRPVLVDAAPEGGSRPAFVYDDTPVGEVVAELQTAYGISIVLESEQLRACPLTATLTGKPLYTQLEIICAALGTSYVVQGTTILISGKGCD